MLDVVEVEQFFNSRHSVYTNQTIFEVDFSQMTHLVHSFRKERHCSFMEKDFLHFFILIFFITMLLEEINEINIIQICVIYFLKT